MKDSAADQAANRIPVCGLGFALVAPKATPGYAGGKKIAYSEEKSRQEKNSLID